MIIIDESVRSVDLVPLLERFWEVSREKLVSIAKSWLPSAGAPVFTVQGMYTSRGWTEWTQGFQFGSELLQYDATDDEIWLDSAREATRRYMPPHLTHFGVHDHGFNNVSTYGNLLRLMHEQRIAYNEWEQCLYETALKVSGAVQARRWTPLPDGGFIHSFNGPHSLFADTIRSLRTLAVAHRLGHVLLEENDLNVSLLQRLIHHACTTARYNVYYGEGRDAYDMRGRVAHESIFNTVNGAYRCPNSQQGFSPFSTWTRGLAWILCGYAELLEFLDTLRDKDFETFGGRHDIETLMQNAATATADFYLEQTPANGIPYWDTGAPLLHKLGDYLNKPADPFNAYEPVDSSAAAIAVQGLLRLGHRMADQPAGHRYWQAGLTVMRTLLQEPYLALDPRHQGLILHSVYHRPNHWDYIPQNARIPCGEASMWGDYHAREAALYLSRIIQQKPYLTFFSVAGCDG